jgi:WD repeat-containing protein 23
VEFAESDFGRSLQKKKAAVGLFGCVSSIERNGFCDRREVCDALLPHQSEKLAQFRHQMFSGKYSPDGELFATSCQDATIRIFDTNVWDLQKTVLCEDVSWAVLDTDYSPDKRWLAYCTWSSRFHMVNVTGDVETHNGFELRPPRGGRFCLFSLRFSPDSTEICGGSCDEGVYTYDLVTEKQTNRFTGHSNDVNAVCYVNDNLGNLIVSGSDDTMVRVFDKRQRDCVGAFPGHVGGITSVDSRDDRYILSNSKDQCVKLWDLRKIGAKDLQPEFAQRFDYRMGGGEMRRLLASSVHENDLSLNTYKSHSVLQTLIRAYFSPRESTGGRYIYTGSFDGSVFIYDCLSGNVVKKLEGHGAPVRDVSWCPVSPELCSVSWDGSVRIWNAKGRHSLPEETEENERSFEERELF